MQEDSTSDDESVASPSVPQMPLGIVIARITVVSGMSFAAALALFFLVGALWVPAIASVGATVVFLALMFAIEKGAEKPQL